MARRKALKSLTFATAILSVCFIVDGGSPLHAQGAYQPGAAFQPGTGGAFQPGAAVQPGTGGAFQPGAVFQPGVGGAYQPGITGPYQPSIGGAPPLGGTAHSAGSFSPALAAHLSQKVVNWRASSAADRARCERVARSRTPPSAGEDFHPQNLYRARTR